MKSNGKIDPGKRLVRWAKLMYFLGDDFFGQENKEIVHGGFRILANKF